jgi:hypothetical protein
MTNDCNKRHLIFSDESGWNAVSRFASLAKISGTYVRTKELNSRLKQVLETYGKNEIKFNDINNKQKITIAKEFISLGYEYLRTNNIKVHILVWDKQDSRHNIIGRCDLENLKMMYYKNMKVLLNHWNNIDTSWEFYPDEFTAIDWETDVITFIKNTRIGKEPNHPQLFEAFRNISFPAYHNTKELKSHNYPIIQLADLYAGLVRTSRNESALFYPWYCQKLNENQTSCFDFNDAVDVTKSLSYKFEVMFDFKRKADSYKMGVSINKFKYFTTYTKKNNIFIWHYEPQGDFDKAPIRRKREDDILNF